MAGVCESFLKFTPTAKVIDKNGTFVTYTDIPAFMRQYFDLGVMNCDNGPTFFSQFTDQYYAPNGTISLTWGPGSKLEKPSADKWTIDWEPDNGPWPTSEFLSGGHQRAIDVKFLAIMEDFSQVSYGSVSISQVAQNVPACDIGGDGIFRWTTENYFEDKTTGTWPIVIGQNGIIGFQIATDNYTGPQLTWDNWMSCCSATGVVFSGSDIPPCVNGEGAPEPGETMTPSPTGILRFWERNFFYNGATQNVVSIDGDPQGFYCCIVEPYGCCGGPAPVASQSFLIPRPTNPEPVEENTSTPILKSPLYLANHTFQFVSNFGRITK